MIKYYKLTLLLLTVLSLYTVSGGSENDILIKIEDPETWECGYVNAKGDTIVPLGKYMPCYRDTIRTWGEVGWNGNFYAINSKDSIIVRIKAFDNGPDRISDGLFRIVDTNGLIGYADSNCRVVIPPQFKCTGQFKNGRAKVTYNCELVPEEGGCGHILMVSEEWFYIDKDGNRVEDDK